MKLSIIIPVFNVEKYLSNCLNSLLRQGLDQSEFEIIAINDGSTDNSLKILNEFSNSFSNFQIHNYINKGPGAIRNIGIDLSQGDYIYYIDSDDYLVDDSLAYILYQAFEYDLDIVTFNTTLTRSLSLTELTTQLPSTDTFEVLNGYAYLSKYNYRNEVWWYIIKKDYLDKLGEKLVEHRWLEDAIFTVKVLLSSNRIMHLPINVHRYFKRPNSLTAINRNVNDVKMIHNMVDVVKDYRDVVKQVNLIEYDKKQCLVNNVKAKQQSFVFFMLVRVLKSHMKFEEVKLILSEVIKAKAYPMYSFPKAKNTSFSYSFLSRLFNNKLIFK